MWLLMLMHAFTLDFGKQPLSLSKSILRLFPGSARLILGHTYLVFYVCCSRFFRY